MSHPPGAVGAERDGWARSALRPHRRYGELDRELAEDRGTALEVAARAEDPWPRYVRLADEDVGRLTWDVEKRTRGWEDDEPPDGYRDAEVLVGVADGTSPEGKIGAEASGCGKNARIEEVAGVGHGEADADGKQVSGGQSGHELGQGPPRGGWGRFAGSGRDEQEGPHDA